MKAKNLIIAYLATVMGASSATVIGINFNSGSTGGGTPDSAGAQAGGNTFGATWTDLIAQSGSGVTLNGTPATLDYTGGDYWRAGSWNSSGNMNNGISLFRNYLNDNGVTLTLNGLNSWLAAEGGSGYTITVFLNTDGGSATFHDVTIGGTPLSVPRLGNGTWNGSIEDPGGDSAGGSRGQAITGVLTGDSVTITVPAWNDPGADGRRGGLAAMVITAVPEPATAGLSVLGALTLLRRRRRD